MRTTVKTNLGHFLFSKVAMIIAIILAMGISNVQAKSDNGKSETYQGEDWTLNNLNGTPVTLSDYQGQPVLLVFWATWCPYCKKLLPGIQSLHEKYGSGKYGKNGLKIIAVNIREDWKPKVYWRNHEYTFDSVLEGDKVAELYGVSGTPGLVFIEPSGKILSVKSFSDPEHPLLEKFASHFVQKAAE